MKRRKMMNSKYETLAKYLNDLFGTNFYIKYFENEEPDWEKVIVADDMVYGSIRVSGGQNQSLKDVYTYIEECGLTLMVKADAYSNTMDGIVESLKTVDKQIILLGEYYYQFNYSNRSDLGKYTIKGYEYFACTIYFNLVSFENLFLGDEQSCSILIGAEVTPFKGITGITYQAHTDFDSSVAASAYTKTHVSAMNQVIVIDGIVVKNDTARTQIKSNLMDKTKTFNVYYNDGETANAASFEARIADYTCLGIAGNLVKYQIKFIQK